jgi:hypothetical protein
MKFIIVVTIKFSSLTKILGKQTRVNYRQTLKKNYIITKHVNKYGQGKVKYTKNIYETRNNMIKIRCINKTS